MPSGLQVKNDGGDYQIDDTYRNLVLRSKTVFAAGGDHAVSLASAVSPVIAMASVDANGMYLASLTVTGGTYDWVVNGVGTVYVFDAAPAGSLHGLGLQVFDAAGNVAFDSGYDYMKPVLRRYYQPYAAGTGTETIPNSDLGRVDGGGPGAVAGSGQIVPGGKVWALAVSTAGNYLWYTGGNTNWGVWGVFTSGGLLMCQRRQLGVLAGGGSLPVTSSGILDIFVVDVTGF